MNNLSDILSRNEHLRSRACALLAAGISYGRTVSMMEYTITEMMYDACADIPSGTLAHALALAGAVRGVDVSAVAKNILNDAQGG